MHNNEALNPLREDLTKDLQFETADNAYEKALNAFDLISGMTDLYATELYRKLKGIEIPQH